MRIIVGLGNPGEKYKSTRHNIGLMVADQLLEKFEPAEKTFWDDEKDLKAQIKKINYKNSSIFLVKPTTFMNNSGFAVSKVLNYYKIDPADLTVIHDDIDLPFGKIRVRMGGAAGGHHGVESIIEQLGTDRFLRIRLGIGSDSRTPGRDRHNADKYVLGNIASGERGRVKTMIREAVRNVELILEHGIEKYMGKYNGK